MCIVLFIVDTDDIGGSNSYKTTSDGWKYTEMNGDDKDYIVVTDYEGKRNADEIAIPGEINGKEVLYYQGAFYNPDLKISKLIIPSQIKEISGCGFETCGIDKVEFEDGSQLEKIGKGTFGIRAMEEVILPDSVRIIEEEAFADAYALKKIYLGDNLETIGDGAFYYTDISEVDISPDNKRFTYDEGLLVDREENRLIAYDHERYSKRIVVPAYIEYVDARCFDGRELEYIDVEEGNRNYASLDGCLYSKDMKTLYRVPPHISAERLQFAEGIAEIGRYAMRNCINLEDIEIPDSVTKIDDLAFDSVNIYIPESLEIADFTHFTGEIYYKGNRKGWDNITITGSGNMNQYRLHFMEEE
jgi:hypothetical protein